MEWALAVPKRDRRTAKDEAAYVLNLRREEPIKTEVIVELRAQNHELWQTQVKLLEALIAANKSLEVYRERQLGQAKWCLEQSASHGKCVPGCARHQWNNLDGWHYTKKEPT